MVLAQQAGLRGEVPIGAVVVDPRESGVNGGVGTELAAAGNTRESEVDPCGHAEVNVLRAAAKARNDWRLDGCELFVTLEPCAMCTGALVLARISRCVYAAPDPKGGFCGTLGSLHEYPGLNHHFTVVAGVLQDESAVLLKSFFKSLRKKVH